MQLIRRWKPLTSHPAFFADSQPAAPPSPVSPSTSIDATTGEVTSTLPSGSGEIRRLERSSLPQFPTPTSSLHQFPHRLSELQLRPNLKKSDGFGKSLWGVLPQVVSQDCNSGQTKKKLTFLKILVGSPPLHSRLEGEALALTRIM
eukprot:1147889-Pelagomonas_calceolata.AAC.4